MFIELSSVLNSNTKSQENVDIQRAFVGVQISQNHNHIHKIATGCLGLLSAVNLLKVIRITACSIYPGSHKC